MSPGQCSCPDCGTILRIRDRSFIGREVECPDCHSKLVINLNDERELVAEHLKVEKPKQKPRVMPAILKKAGPTFATRLANLLHSPLVLAWALGIGITAFIAIMMLRPNVRFRKPSSDPMAQKPLPAEALQPSEAETDATPLGPDADPVVVKEPDIPAEVPTHTESPPAKTPGTEDPLVEIPITPIVEPEPAPEAKLNPAPVVVKLDLEAMLGQRLKSFETPARLKSRREILELLEELLGAPILYSAEELGEKNLDRSITIDLENTTVGGVLKVVLDSAGWEYIVEEKGLRIRPRQVAETPM